MKKYPGPPAKFTPPGSSIDNTVYMREWRAARPELARAAVQRASKLKQARRVAALEVARNHPEEFEAALDRECERRGLTDAQEVGNVRASDSGTTAPAPSAGVVASKRRRSA